MALKKINRSGTILTGGLAQNFALSRSTRRGYSIRNTSAHSLWISDIGPATMDDNSFELKPGEAIVERQDDVSTTTISIIGPVTGQGFYGREW